MTFFLLLIVIPFILLFLIIHFVFKTKHNAWLSKQAATKKWYWFFILVPLVSVLLFVLVFWLWYDFVVTTNANIDSSGMGLVIFIPPLIISLILLLTGLLTKFLNFKRGIKTNNAIFVIMGLLCLPSALLGIVSLAGLILMMFKRG